MWSANHRSRSVAARVYGTHSDASVRLLAGGGVDDNTGSPRARVFVKRAFDLGARFDLADERARHRLSMRAFRRCVLVPERRRGHNVPPRDHVGEQRFEVFGHTHEVDGVEHMTRFALERLTVQLEG